jgi:hypothetical protein
MFARDDAPALNRLPGLHASGLSGFLPGEPLRGTAALVLFTRPFLLLRLVLASSTLPWLEPGAPGRGLFTPLRPFRTGFVLTLAILGRPVLLLPEAFAALTALSVGLLPRLLEGRATVLLVIAGLPISPDPARLVAPSPAFEAWLCMPAVRAFALSLTVSNFRASVVRSAVREERLCGPGVAPLAGELLPVEWRWITSALTVFVTVSRKRVVMPVS